MMSVGPIGSTLRHKKALGRLRDRGGLPLPWGFQQGLRRGGFMAERAEEERRDPAADAVAVAVYSVLVLLLMLAWTYVPA